jgi:hypothetical protein
MKGTNIVENIARELKKRIQKPISENSREKGIPGSKSMRDKL